MLPNIGRNSPAGVVNYLLDDAPDVAITFGKVKRAKLCRGLVVMRMRLELQARSECARTSRIDNVQWRASASVHE
jgi:hypothetical protein